MIFTRWAVWRSPLREHECLSVLTCPKSSFPSQSVLLAGNLFKVQAKPADLSLPFTRKAVLALTPEYQPHRARFGADPTCSLLLVRQAVAVLLRAAHPSVRVPRDRVTAMVSVTHRAVVFRGTESYGFYSFILSSWKLQAAFPVSQCITGVRNLSWGSAQTQRWSLFQKAK